MAVEFSRSLHSLKADRYIVPVILIGFVIVLILVWLGWLLLGSVPEYKEGTSLRSGENGVVYAKFPYQIRQELRAGQPATVSIPGKENVPTTEIEGMVYEVSYDQTNDEVSVFITENNPTLPDLVKDPSASVKVLVKSYSPLEFMLNRSNVPQPTPSGGR